MRGQKGVQFTTQGEFLAKCADEMLERLRSIKEEVWNMDQEVVGSIRLGVSNFFAKYMLPRLLSQFKEQFPNYGYMQGNDQTRTGIWPFTKCTI